MKNAQEDSFLLSSRNVTERAHTLLPVENTTQRLLPSLVLARELFGNFNYFS